jgi:hypothetical protein
LPSKQPDKTGYPRGGRPKGSKNKRTLEIEAEAKKHAGNALAALASIAERGESEAARVSAATALLDRGYGRPRQALEHSGTDGGPIVVVQAWKFGDKLVSF